MSGIIGPKIVTNGLVLALDAANTKSYPGSGTTWNDLSGNGYNATLYNGASFNSDAGGNINLDGVNDYVEIPNNSGYTVQSGSIDYWVNAIDQRGFILYGGTSTSQNFYILHGSGTSGFTNDLMIDGGELEDEIFDINLEYYNIYYYGSYNWK